MKSFTYFITLAILFVIPFKLQAQSMRDSVSREEKLYALSLIWKEADYNFAFFDRQPKLQWDSLYISYIPKILATKNVYEYVKVLSNFMKLLKDGHTGVQLNQTYWNEIDSPPVKYENRQEKRFVTSVDDALKDQIPIGSEITHLNGKTWEEYFKNTDLEDNDWFGFAGTKLELTLITKNKEESKVTVTRNVNKLFRAKNLKWVPNIAPQPTENFGYKSVSPEIAYVTLGTFSDSTIVGEFKKNLPDIRKHQTLIVDIRNNRGGNDDYALQIAEYLTDQSYIVGSMWKTRINNAAKKAWAVQGDSSLTDYLHRNVWEKHAGDTIRIPKSIIKLNMPVYILISKKTFSAAEDFLIYLNYSKNVIRVGQTTGGSSGQPLVFQLPHGFSARICAKADEFPDGTQFINIGIKPHIAVEPSFIEGKDSELEKTLVIIEKNKSF